MLAVDRHCAGPLGASPSAPNHTAPAGAGTNSFTWTPIVPTDGTYEVFVRYAQGVAGAATNAAYTVDTGTAKTSKTVDQTTGGGTWVSLGSYPLTAGNKAKVSLSDAADGTVSADSVKLVRDHTADVDTEDKTFADTYDPNGNLVSLSDTSPGAKVDTYAMTYTGSTSSPRSRKSWPRS